METICKIFSNLWDTIVIGTGVMTHEVVLASGVFILL